MAYLSNNNVLDLPLPEDLSLFEGMEGFEDFDVMDDSAVTTVFADLQEGTLLSILEDNLSDIDTNKPISRSMLLNESESLDEPHQNSDHEVQGYNLKPLQLLSSELVSATPCQSRGACVTDDCMARKRVRHNTYGSDLSPKEQQSLVDLHHVMDSIQHDHCYTTAKNTEDRRPSSISGQSIHSSSSDSVEEGSNSDGGYDTMSVSTSPSTCDNNESSTLASPKTTLPKAQSSCFLPSLSLGELADPVALIDARIKHFMCNHEVNLTEEEKETLKLEGLPIPTTLPLTKVEEKALRNVRKKIRNKEAARESRRRKKENLHHLEERVKECSTENMKLKKRIQTLESENKVLLAQLKKFQILASVHSGSTHRSTQVGACLMVILLCFGVIMGSYMPKEVWNYSQGQTDYTTISVRSRSLLSIDYHQTNCQNLACDWLHHIFVKDVSSPPLPNTIEEVNCRKTYVSASPTSMLSSEEHVQVFTPSPNCNNRTCTTYM